MRLEQELMLYMLVHAGGVTACEQTLLMSLRRCPFAPYGVHTYVIVMFSSKNGIVDSLGFVFNIEGIW